MSLKSARRQGKQVWRNWTEGLKNTEEWWERQKARKEVSLLKKLMHRYERRHQARIILRSCLNGSRKIADDGEDAQKCTERP